MPLKPVKFKLLMVKPCPSVVLWLAVTLLAAMKTLLMTPGGPESVPPPAVVTQLLVPAVVRFVFHTDPCEPVQ